MGGARQSGQPDRYMYAGGFNYCDLLASYVQCVLWKLDLNTSMDKLSGTEALKTITLKN